MTGPTEAALCRRFGARALLSLDEGTDKRWRQITADEDRFVLTGRTRT